MTGCTEYDSAHHLLTAPSIAGRTRQFIGERDFDWIALFEASKGWSRGERILVQAAFDLWSGGREFDGRSNVHLFDPIETLDNGTLDRLIEAILIRRGGRPKRRRTLASPDQLRLPV